MHTTQTVFGEGPESASIALVGEQPGDQEALRIDSSRGRIIQRHAKPDLLITVHPSYLLRVPSNVQAREFERFVADLQLARPYLNAAA